MLQGMTTTSMERDIASVGAMIRTWLLTEFPEQAPALTNQCKRASILFDLYAKEREWNSRIRSGWVKGMGHVWNEVQLNRQWYIVDMTLTQFQPILSLPVPDVVFGRRREIFAAYHYWWDGKGNYPYRLDDVRPSLWQRLSALLVNEGLIDEGGSEDER